MRRWQIFSGYQEPVLSNASFRNLQVISVVSKNDRVEILYVYSKEYIYTDEDGHSQDSLGATQGVACG